MKWFKTASLIFLFTVTIYILIISHYSLRLSSPLSTKNDYLFTFKKAIHLSGLPLSNLVIRDFTQQIEFKTNDTLVLFSSEKSFYQQVSYLHQLLTLAKIKHTNLTQLNLSIKHPYATFQVN